MKLFKDSHGRTLSLQGFAPGAADVLYSPHIVSGYFTRYGVHGGGTSYSYSSYASPWNTIGSAAAGVGCGIGLGAIHFLVRMWPVFKFSTAGFTNKDEDSSPINVSGYNYFFMPYNVFVYQVPPFLIGYGFNLFRWRRFYSPNFFIANPTLTPNPNIDMTLDFRWVTSTISGSTTPDRTWLRTNSVSFFTRKYEGLDSPEMTNEFLYGNDAVHQGHKSAIPLSNFQANTHGIFIDFLPEPPEVNPFECMYGGRMWFGFGIGNLVFLL